MGNASDVEKAFAELAARVLTRAATTLPPEHVNALKQAHKRETVPTAMAQLDTILANVTSAANKTCSICQDPGIPAFEVAVGSKFPLHFDVRGVLAEITAEVTAAVPLRQNICHPFTRTNSGNNTGRNVPYVWYEYLPGADYVEVCAHLRGGGSGNRSMVFAVAPSAPRLEGVKKIVFDHVAMAGPIVCPPAVIGVGLGATPDIAMKIAFNQLMRLPVGKPHPEADMAKAEADLCAALNKTGIGALGLGGDTTVLAVHMEYAGSHIGSMPVGIAFSCWPNRFAAARLFADGCVEWLTHQEEGK